MKGSVPRQRRGGLAGWWWKCAVLIFCSLPGITRSSERADLEMQETRVAIEALRRENTRLRRELAQRQFEMGALTNKNARTAQDMIREITLADDSEARSSREWKFFLLDALKALDKANQDEAQVRKQMNLLLYASQEAFKSAQNVNPSKRALLETQMRKVQKMLSEDAELHPRVFAEDAETSAPQSIKITAVRLDLGVAALEAGKDRGIRVGMPFVVVRGKNPIAVITVAEVRERLALGIIDQMDPDSPVKKGDTALLRRQ